MRTLTYEPEDEVKLKRDIEFARRCNNRANGLYWDGELAGPDGMNFMFFAPEGTTDEELEKAEEELRQNQDVIHCTVLFVPAEWVADDDRDKPSATEEEKITKIRAIKEGVFNKVDGVALDSFSASAIIAVYDAISAENKRKFAALPVLKMANVAFKLVK